MRKGGCHPVVILALAVCFAQAAAHADPRADLESPSQQVRDKAAKYLRETYTPPPRKKWAPVLAAIKKGDSEKQVMEALRPYGAVEKNQGGDLGMCFVVYQLDNSWRLDCTYFGTGQYNWTPGTVYSAGLGRHAATVDVRPPSGFTGVWTTYYANGEKHLVCHYQDGQVIGRGITYNDDGSKMTGP